MMAVARLWLKVAQCKERCARLATSECERDIAARGVVSALKAALSFFEKAGA